MSEIADLSAPCDAKPPPGTFDEPPAPRPARKPRPVRVAVIGEFNSGKTTLLNALLGAAVLPASFITHTAYPTVLRFAPRPTLSAEVAGRRRVAFTWEDLDGAPSHHIHRVHVGMPLDRLRTLHAIDTPGLGLGDPVLEERIVKACRSADLVIWCTPAMQAWKASEQHVWLSLPRYVRRRGILAVTFMDTLTAPADAGRVMARLHAVAGDLFSRIVTTATQGVDEVLAAQTEDVVG
ncbi:MAG: dynamin family protein [Hyphomicrobiaceae bacterium]